MSANYAQLGSSDFEEAIARKLPPRGLAWPRLPGTVFQNFWTVVADAIATIHARGADLTEQEGFPPASVELLPDWESVLGLPDPCLGQNGVTAARQAAVQARLAATGGQSVPYFQQLAVTLGSAVGSYEYAPFRAGVDRAMNPLYSAAWANIWGVQLTQNALFRFEAQVSAAGEPLWFLANGPVQCEISRLAPAHVKVVFLTAVSGIFLSDFSLTDSGALVT